MEYIYINIYSIPSTPPVMLIFETEVLNAGRYKKVPPGATNTGRLHDKPPDR